MNAWRAVSRASISEISAECSRRLESEEVAIRDGVNSLHRAAIPHPSLTILLGC